MFFSLPSQVLYSESRLRFQATSQVSSQGPIQSDQVQAFTTIYSFVSPPSIFCTTKKNHGCLCERELERHLDGHIHNPAVDTEYGTVVQQIVGKTDGAVKCQKINSPRIFYSRSTRAQIQLIASLIEFFFYSLKASMFLCSLQITVFDKIHMHAASLPPTVSLSCITFKSLSTTVMAYEI